MKLSPVLFKGPLVRAILSGVKTMTRRVVKPQPELIPADVWKDTRNGETHWWASSQAQMMLGIRDMSCFCPYGVPGDTLWVREKFMVGADEIAYAATDQPLVGCDRWRPSIHMNRVYSRITLAIESVRVERLQEITEADAVAEGCEGFYSPPYVSNGEISEADGEAPTEEFRRLWQSINGPGSWDANPWVWALTFSRVQP